MLVLTSSAFAQRIAIFDFNAGTGVTQVEVDGLSAIFNTYFEPKGAEIIERTRVDRLLQEHKFQKSKFTTSDMVAMGEQLNASLVVVGDVNIVMEQYNVDIRVVNVQTGTIVAKDGISFDKNTSYRGTMQQLGERLAKKMELEIEKINIESKDGGSTLPKNMTTKITEDNSKREISEVVVLHGYLKLYPEDLGEFHGKPYDLIRKINEEEKYGYDSWRLPTQEELDIIRSNGYLSGLKYMTQSDPRGVLLLVTIKDPVVHKSKLPIAKHDISLHGGIGAFYSYVSSFGFSIGMKYKYKPFDKYDIRLLGEIGTAFTSEDTLNGLSIIPIMAGINYEYRFTESLSIWTDLTLGLSGPLSGRRYTWGSEYYYAFDSGVALSPEIGIRYNDFSFSFKFIFSSNPCHKYGYGGGIDHSYESLYFLFQLGYHF
mgnify:FL=1